MESLSEGFHGQSLVGKAFSKMMYFLVALRFCIQQTYLHHDFKVGFS